MKKIVLLFLIIPSVIYGQHITWPVSGKEAGDGVIYRPQDYIDEEFNYSCLIITAPEGTEIVSPVSGKLLAYQYMYNDKLEHGYFYTLTDKTDEEQRTAISQSIWEKYKKKADPKYVTASLLITTGERETYSISGIRPDENLKTGMRLEQGDKIGTMGYCFKSVTQPAIMVSRSIDNRAADPMTPFGIKSTFIPSSYTKTDPKQRHKATQLKTDFSVLRGSLEEGHPGLYDYNSRQHMDSLFDDTFAKIKDDMNTYEFYRLLYSLVSQIRDGHTHLSHVSDPAPPSERLSTVAFSLFDDTLRVSRVCNKKDLDLIGKEVIAVDGINAGELKIRFKKMNEKDVYPNQEGFIQSISAVGAGIFFFSYYTTNYPLKRDGITLTFADGSERTFPFAEKGICVPYIPSVNYRYQPDAGVIYKTIDGRTALLDINTFGLSDMDRDSIGLFIRDIEEQKYENLIIDVRYNKGGDFGKLFDYIADQPFQGFIGFKVNQNDTYNFFRYCSNFTAEDRYMFPDYRKDEENGGYCLPKDSLKLSYPSDSTHFSGRVYVLTDERTFSAASVFAGLVHKYRRGVTVGRETGSAYHQINAVKFANVLLEHSRLSIRFPLVKCIFDYPENSDIPWGRGILPDYPFEFSVDELINDEDVMLHYTLRLIEEDKYIKEEPKSAVERGQLNSCGNVILLIIGLTAVVVISLALCGRIRKTNRQKKPK